jgi:hypothetical protein
MKKMLFGFAALAAIAFASGAARAADTLIYGFEPDAQGFGPNGGGVTVAQDTVGATEGTHSLKTSVVAGATFVGALTTNLPASLNNPPGVDHVTFDLTIPQGGQYTGAGFDVLGITIFGSNAPLGQFGLQAQFAPLFHIDGKAPGTYTNITIPLTGATNPLTFAAGQTFNDIFTTGTPDATHLVPSGFEFFIHKSNDSATTVYFDNVRIGSVPEPASLALASLGAIGLVAVARRRYR